MAEINTGTYIKRYSFWNPATWAIPSLYWDVFSNEQRWHAICKELGKVINYADYLGINVDDVAGRLKAIEDGQLDDLIKEKIEEWFEENEPEIIAALEQMHEDIERLENAEMYIGVVDAKYALTLVQANDKNIVFDCGSLDDATLTQVFFADELKHKKVEHLDAVVITHFHADHYEGFEILAPYCDETTDIFIQMPATLGTDAAYNDYTTGKNYVDNVIAIYGLKDAIVPLESEIYDYDGVTLRFWNTSAANCSSYDTAFSNSGTVQSTRKQARSLNNYSLITRVEYLGNSYIDTGDIECAAELNYENKIGKANVAKCPHHFANRMGIYNFFKELSPDIWFSTANWMYTEGGYWDRPINNIYQYSYMAGYLARFLMWENDTTPYLTNIQGNINIYMANGNVHEFNGYECGLDNYTLDRMHYTMCLPPEYYNAYPFCLQNAALDANDQEIAGTNVNLPVLANTINDYAKQYGLRIFGIGYDANIPLSKQLYDCFPGFETNNQIYFAMGAVLFEAQYMNPYHHASVLKIEPGYDLADPLKRIIRTSPGALYYKATSFDTTNYINSADWTFLRQANILEIVLSGYVSVPVTRCKIDDYNANYTGECFVGMRANEENTYLYTALVKSTREMVVKRIRLSDMDTQDQTVITVAAIA